LFDQKANIEFFHRFVGGKILPGKNKETTIVFEIYEDGALIERIT